MDGPSCETGGANGFMVETIRDRRKTGLPDSISKTFLRVSLIWFFGCARLSIQGKENRGKGCLLGVGRKNQ
jgi:hypothetical protein